MNKRFIGKVAVVFGLLTGLQVVAQESCDDLNSLVKKYLEPKNGESGVYISDGQEYRVFLDGDQKSRISFHLLWRLYLQVGGFCGLTASFCNI